MLVPAPVQDRLLGGDQHALDVEVGPNLAGDDRVDVRRLVDVADQPASLQQLLPQISLFRARVGHQSFDAVGDVRLIVAQSSGYRAF
jgi:hypothetical protein